MLSNINQNAKNIVNRPSVSTPKQIIIVSPAIDYNFTLYIHSKFSMNLTQEKNVQAQV